MAGEPKGVRGKCKKAGRNDNKCKLYINSGRRQKNKLRRLKRHTAQQPNDNCARASLLATGKLLPGQRVALKKKRG